MKRIRIGNIEFRPTENDRYLGEFICCKPNPYYGCEHEYVQDSEDPNYYRKPSNLPGSKRCGAKIHKSCFVNPEVCYVLARLTNEDEPDVLSVGDRPWTMDEDEEEDFKTVITLVFKEAYKR